jgi:hypothetical protein
MKTAKDFAHLKINGYKNINEIKLINKRLHSIQTLFGDLNAKILILLHNPANFFYYYKLSKKKKDFFRHDESSVTNINLVKIFKPHFELVNINGCNARTCGLFAANIIWLLRDDLNKNIIKSNTDNSLIKECRSVFFETIESLKNLKLIIAFGHIPYYACENYFGYKVDLKKDILNHRKKLIKYKNKSFFIVPAPSTSPRAKFFSERIWTNQEQEWQKSMSAWIKLIK